tara:strand:+ start:4810 stop:5157 length:348 start_codon:yes stop_codon:yes gene_type:complete
LDLPLKKIIFSFLFLLLFPSSALAEIEKDKQKHFAVSYSVGVGTSLIFDDWKTSLVACSAVGLGKEIYDEIDYHGFSKEDLAYDILGCSLGVLTVEGLSFSLKKDYYAIQYQYKF